MDAELASYRVKASGLVAKFGGEEQDALARRCGNFARFAHTKPSGVDIATGCDTAFLATAPMDTSWSAVGSAQQYQGSLRKGTGLGAWAIFRAAAAMPAALLAACQICANVG